MVVVPDTIHRYARNAIEGFAISHVERVTLTTKSYETNQLLRASEHKRNETSVVTKDYEHI